MRFQLAKEKPPEPECAQVTQEAITNVRYKIALCKLFQANKMHFKVELQPTAVYLRFSPPTAWHRNGFVNCSLQIRAHVLMETK